LFAKKSEKEKLKSLLPLNLKKCIMVKTWGTYAPWFDHNYLNDNKMLSWSCNDTYISWIPWMGNCFHLFGYFWTRNTPYVVSTCHENLMINLCFSHSSTWVYIYLPIRVWYIITNFKKYTMIKKLAKESSVLCHFFCMKTNDYLRLSK
jgi:hypothetical protein